MSSAHEFQPEEDQKHPELLVSKALQDPKEYQRVGRDIESDKTITPPSSRK
jgi:hypothetical protein